MFFLPHGEPNMPTLDVVSRVDYAEIDNALNNTKKALMQRFDFRGAAYEINVDKKEKKLSLNAEDGTKLGAIRETFFTHALRRGLNVKSFEVEDPLPGAGGNVKQTCKIREGLEGDLAKKIVKLVKENKLKVQASILGDEVRLTSKSIDDLRETMAMLTAADVEVPLQFVNMKS